MSPQTPQPRLTAAESEVAGLRAALEGLLDEQNGVPLFTREKEYLAAVEAARTALRPANTQTNTPRNNPPQP